MSEEPTPMSREELIATLYTETPRVEIVKEPFEKYLATPAVSRSGFVDQFDPDQGGCPHLFLMSMLFPDLMSDKSTVAWEMGTALHHYLLEPDEFAKRYQVLDEDRKSIIFQDARDTGSKAKGFSKNLAGYQAWKDACEARGETIIGEETIAKFERMRKLFEKHPDISEILAAPHQTEVSIYAGYAGPAGTWEKQIQCKARIDILPDPNAGTTAFDLKKARESSPVKFSKAVADRRLDIQAAFYRGVLQWAGRDIRDFTFIAMEDEFPFLIGVHDMPESWLRWGELHFQTLLGDLKVCLERNHWPTPGRNVLLPPAWLEKQMENIV